MKPRRDSNSFSVPLPGHRYSVRGHKSPQVRKIRGANRQWINEWLGLNHHETINCGLNFFYRHLFIKVIMTLLIRVPTITSIPLNIYLATDKTIKLLVAQNTYKYCRMIKTTPPLIYLHSVHISNRTFLDIPILNDLSTRINPFTNFEPTENNRSRPFFKNMFC